MQIVNEFFVSCVSLVKLLLMPHAYLHSVAMYLIGHSKIFLNEGFYICPTCVIVGLVWFMVFNATFNNISVILWWSVLLVQETGVPGENH